MLVFATFALCVYFLSLSPTIAGVLFVILISPSCPLTYTPSLSLSRQPLTTSAAGSTAFGVNAVLNALRNAPKTSLLIAKAKMKRRSSFGCGHFQGDKAMALIEMEVKERVKG